MRRSPVEIGGTRFIRILLLGLMAILPSLACGTPIAPQDTSLQATGTALAASLTEMSAQLLMPPQPSPLPPSFTQPSPTQSWPTQPGPTQPSPAQPSTPDVPPIGNSYETYDVRETIILTNDGPGAASSIEMWVAMIRDIDPYQDVVSVYIDPMASDTVVDEFGNQYAFFETGPLSVGSQVQFSLQYEVDVYALDFSLGSCQGTLIGEFTGPVEFIESDHPSIVNLATSLAQGQGTACARARAFYDWVAENIIYSGYIPDDIGALQTLNDLEGDCTCFADLMMALSRAAGIPARFLEGVTCCTEGEYVPGDIKHDWLEVYLPGVGWVPMDPTWGQQPEYRETYYAGITPDHIVVTQGRNLSMLSGYHYNYYLYYWDGERADVSSQLEWSIVKQGD
jgi:transglutaminase-like putative cysteine protease